MPRNFRSGPGKCKRCLGVSSEWSEYATLFSSVRPLQLIDECGRKIVQAMASAPPVDAPTPLVSKKVIAAVALF